jgi:hypothetical protein
MRATRSWSGALYSFQHDNSCPANRMNVKHVKVPLADLVEPRQPPAEIAADAERLAVWKQTNDEELARYDRLTAVDISGCGSHADYFCWEKHHLHDNYGCIPMDLDRPLSDFTTLPLKPSSGQWVRQRLACRPPSVPPRRGGSAERSAAFLRRDQGLDRGGISRTREGDA